MTRTVERLMSVVQPFSMPSKQKLDFVGIKIDFEDLDTWARWELAKRLEYDSVAVSIDVAELLAKQLAHEAVWQALRLLVEQIEAEAK